MEHIDKILLHIGCANRLYEGFVNIDKFTVSPRGKSYTLDKVMDIGKTWDYADESVDGIVSMHVLQQITWRELVVALREAYRVLKKGGVMRIGVPTIENGRSLDYLLGWANINLYSVELLSLVLVKHIGFTGCKYCKYQETAIPEFAQVDNRPDQTFYFEVTK